MDVIGRALDGRESSMTVTMREMNDTDTVKGAPCASDAAALKDGADMRGFFKPEEATGADPLADVGDVCEDEEDSVKSLDGLADLLDLG